MAASMVIISGWIGLAYAMVGYIVTGSSLGQFMLTWMVVGLIATAAFGLIAAIRRFAAPSSALPA